MAQVLDRVLRCYRIGDPNGRYRIFDATGSTITPGRWNAADSPVIYTSEHYSTAMLEKLAHGGGALPPDQHFIEITLPNGLSYEMVTPHTLPGWDGPDETICRDFGRQWQKSRRSALLFVPSIVARLEHNILINPDHPETRGITHGLHQPVWWDLRLFA